jgi:hypothetical protein
LLAKEQFVNKKKKTKVCKLIYLQTMQFIIIEARFLGTLQKSWCCPLVPRHNVGCTKLQKLELIHIRELFSYLLCNCLNSHVGPPNAINYPQLDRCNSTFINYHDFRVERVLYPLPGKPKGSIEGIQDEPFLHVIVLLPGCHEIDDWKNTVFGNFSCLENMWLEWQNKLTNNIKILINTMQNLDMYVSTNPLSNMSLTFPATSASAT